MTNARSATRSRNDWIVDRLESWGRWQQIGSNSYHGSSSLLIDPDHQGALRAYIPVLPVECEQTHDAVMKQPRQLQEVAVALYVRDWDRPALARHLRVSPQHVSRLHEMLRNGVQFCLENHRVKTPPLRVVMKLGAR
ncbi:hypothetical protein [Ralstonia insidiosa]|uniref:Antitermination protein Q n=1 Tax=Ralstonia insidiosa TaxID=190721 RepID=A0A848NU31_9RALS|nr:hypothetical protein [Ralstonia insidiosa]NMV36790.1 hypothetical protein [Ralstonia insidiosa]